MTVWDSMALNAPAEARELAQDGEPAPGSTTEPENATCPSAGGFGGLAVAKPLAWDEPYQGVFVADTTFGRWAIKRAAGMWDWWSPQYDDDSFAPEQFDTIEVAKAAAQADYEARIQSVLQGIVTPQAILTAIAAEKAEWPYAGPLHDGARKACDNIATRIKQLMGDA